MRWMLQMDRPVPTLSEEQAEAQMTRDYGWNFAVNVLDGAFFWFGLSFTSASTIVPLFISKLTTSPVPIGLAAMLAQGGWFLPQLLSANWVERLPRKKPVVVNLGFLMERLPTWVVIPCALMAASQPGLALALFLLVYAWRTLGGGVVAVAWQEMIARIFPVNRRGRFLGITTSFGTVAGMAGSGLSAWLLATHPFPLNFVYTFGLAAAAIGVSWFFLALTREPARPVTARRQSQRQFLASLPDLVRNDPPFRRFLVARLALSLGQMGLGFVTVSAIRRWGIADSMAGTYTAALLLGESAGNLFLGLLGDRRGHKLSLELGAIISAIAFALAWLAPGPEWYLLVFCLVGIGLGAAVTSGMLVVMEFCEPERRPTYLGLANTAVGLTAMAGPLLATWLATLSYELLFGLSAAISLSAFVAMRWWVAEPRCRMPAD